MGSIEKPERIVARLMPKTKFSAKTRALNVSSGRAIQWGLTPRPPKD